MMRYTQFIATEICRECNYAKIHEHKCPSGDEDRYGRLDTSQPMTDDQIVDLVVTAYAEMGFRGLWAAHLYNEPCLAFDRIEKVFLRIRSRVPAARSVLWTNGTKLPKDLNRLQIFSQMWVSNYLNRDWRFLEEYVPKVTVMPDVLDIRNEGRIRVDNRRCLRMFNELIFDYYGNAHICCVDIRGEVHLGNIHRDSFQSIVDQFRWVRKDVIRDPMPAAAPSICRLCPLKFPDRVGYLDESIWPAAQQYADAHR